VTVQNISLKICHIATNFPSQYQTVENVPECRMSNLFSAVACNMASDQSWIHDEMSRFNVQILTISYVFGPRLLGVVPIWNNLHTSLNSGWDCTNYCLCRQQGALWACCGWPCRLLLNYLTVYSPPGTCHNTCLLLYDKSVFTMFSAWHFQYLHLKCIWNYISSFFGK